jgi:hypothetical protein
MYRIWHTIEPPIHSESWIHEESAEDSSEDLELAASIRAQMMGTAMNARKKRKKTDYSG